MNEIQIESKNIKVTPYGIDFINDPTVEEIQNALKSIMKIDTMCQFYIGDLINRATWQWGEKYEQWEKATGYSNEALRRFASISSRFSGEFRESICSGVTTKSNIISFEHYKIVAPLSNEKALYFLEMVRDGRWSVAKLETEILISKNGGRLPEEREVKEPNLPDGFVSFKDAETDVDGFIPVPKTVGETKHIIARPVAMTDWEARLVLGLISDNPRLTMLRDRIERTFEL